MNKLDSDSDEVVEVNSLKNNKSVLAFFKLMLNIYMYSVKLYRSLVG